MCIYLHQRISCLRDTENFEMENRFEGFDGEDDESNPVFHEYFQYVMDNNGLSHPTSIHEAGVLFEKLIKFAKDEL